MTNHPEEQGPVSLTRPREPIRGRVALFATTYACVVLLQRAAEGTSLSLFLDHLGASKLPFTFLAVSLVDIPLAFAYITLAKRMDRRWLLVALAAVLVTAMAGSRVLDVILPGWGLFFAYLSATVLTTFLAIHWGVLLLDAFTVDESRRAFPLIYAGGHAGSFAAGAAMQMAGPWTARDLMVFIPAVAWVGILVLMTILGKQKEGLSVRQSEPRPGVAAAPSAWKNLGLLSRLPLLRIIAVSTAIMVLLRLCLRLLYGQELQSAFSSPEALTRFVGSYTMIASIAGISIQLLLTPRLLRIFGVGKVNMAYAGAMLVSFTGLLGFPGLMAATFARFTDLELKNAIKTPLSTMFYDALAQSQRADARAIILGIISPLSSLGSSLLLIAFTQIQAPSHMLAWVAFGAAMAFVASSFLQSKAYHDSLEQQLQNWAAEHSGNPHVSLADAIEAARRCHDPRIVDMAREVRRRTIRKALP